MMSRLFEDLMNVKTGNLIGKYVFQSWPHYFVKWIKKKMISFNNFWMPYFRGEFTELLGTKNL